MGIEYSNSKQIDELLSSGYVVLESGFGQFRVESCVSRISKNGNKMVEIVYKVKDAKGQYADIKDYIVEGNEMTEINVAKFLASVNAYDDFDGDFKAEKYVGRKGRCEIFHEEFVSKKGKVLQSNRIEKMPAGKEWDVKRYESLKLTEKQINDRLDELGLVSDYKRAASTETYLQAHQYYIKKEREENNNQDQELAAQSFDDDIPF